MKGWGKSGELDPMNVVKLSGYESKQNRLMVNFECVEGYMWSGIVNNKANTAL